mmetsp:Transcript_67089/g.140120  ORF Transcript_67089/g.140120 Transcript_67089/m.140120 type:complete len:270 (-) Transcript_67089:1147-1956(-)
MRQMMHELLQSCKIQRTASRYLKTTMWCCQNWWHDGRRRIWSDVGACDTWFSQGVREAAAEPSDAHFPAEVGRAAFKRGFFLKLGRKREKLLPQQREASSVDGPGRGESDCRRLSKIDGQGERPARPMLPPWKETLLVHFAVLGGDVLPVSVFVIYRIVVMFFICVRSPRFWVERRIASDALLCCCRETCCRCLRGRPAPATACSLASCALGLIRIVERRPSLLPAAGMVPLRQGYRSPLTPCCLAWADCPADCELLRATGSSLPDADQ